MHTGLICLWVTGALLLPQCLGSTDSSAYEYDSVTPTDDYADYTFLYESVDYDMYETPNRGIKPVVKEEGVSSGMSQINDEVSTVCRYYAVGLALIVQRFCQQT
ncbi:uncharacterized protein Hap1MRO34_005926 isoform 2-T2 [Clarias gariepinus]